MENQAVPIDISIVVPILNEADSLEELHRQLSQVLQALNRPYEILWVDDGSTDRSVAICRELAQADAHTALVEMRRHFGKAVALQAGFQVARGNFVLTLDGDLQDDPTEIPHFIQTLEAGADVVSGWKQRRQDPSLRLLQSRLFNFCMRQMTGIPLHDFNCGFKAYRREAVAMLDLYGDLHRYIPALAHAKGFVVQEIPVRHHPRKHGRSRYGVERIWRGPLDLLTVVFLITYQTRPLHFFGPAGLGLGAIGGLIDAYLTVLWFLGDRPIGNRPLLTLGTLLITMGLQVFLFGLLAEMIVATTHQRARVLELVRRIVRHSDHEAA